MFTPNYTVRNRELIANLAQPVTFIANHSLAADPAILATVLPGKKNIVLTANDPSVPVAQKLDPTARLTVVNPAVADDYKQLLASDLATEENLVVFPEGRTQQIGSLGKMNVMVAQLAAKLTAGYCVPLNINPVTRTVTCCPVRQLVPPEGVTGKELRVWQETSLRRMLEEAMFAAADIDIALPSLLVDRARYHGMNTEVFRQVIPEPRALTYRLLLRAAFALGAELAKRHRPGERVALLLPSSVGAAAAFYACHFAGLVPVMLNFSSGSTNLLSACKTAQVAAVYTAKGLLERLEAARDGVAALQEEGYQVTHLEDVRDGLSITAKLRALWRSLLPGLGLAGMPGSRIQPQNEAVVLFTSGSEGPPKGVALSHQNLVANAHQILCRVHIEKQDLLFNSLPVFHSFGMIGGLVLPVAGGLPTLQFPSPLLYKEIPAYIQAEGATIIFSTSTLFNQYGRNAHQSDMSSLRLIIAGGERLQDGVKELWLREFGKRIHEGYGVTETAPALSVATDQTYHPHSIGLLLPGIEHRLEPIAGVATGGRLVVKGPNVMMGYLLAEEPGVIKPPADGWHDTGDIVTVNPAGFVTIIGRVKRFAKIAGEMIPLNRVEEVLEGLSEEDEYAVVAIPDPQRGEQLILVTTQKGVDRQLMTKQLQAVQLPELWVPRHVVVIEQIPLLPTGKKDYPSVLRLVTAADINA